MFINNSKTDICQCPNQGINYYYYYYKLLPGIFYYTQLLIPARIYLLLCNNTHL